MRIETNTVSMGFGDRLWRKNYRSTGKQESILFSGRQRQRIAIARAAIRNAPIVILDEPTVGLDNHSERIVTDALDRLTQTSTTIVRRHRHRTRNGEYGNCYFYVLSRFWLSF
jgi:ABC-type multidrug transport system fused ATPase/permease subunit